MSESSSSMTVTPDEGQIGTSSNWVICKSTKRNNLVYYFNPTTGESVWNLSDAKKERAKNQTSEECSEPVEPPVPRPSTSQMSNMQPLAIINTPRVTELPQTTVIYQQFMTPPPFYTSTNGVPQYHDITERNVVWDRPPPNYAIPPPVLLQGNSTTMLLSERFKKQRELEPIIVPKPEIKVINKPFKRTIQPKMKQNIGLDDLRVKLTARRLLLQNARSAPRSTEQYEDDANETTIENSMCQLDLTDKVKIGPEIYDNFTETKPVTRAEVGQPSVELCEEDDETWLAENTVLENDKYQVDVTPLRAKVPLTDCWYIVADTNVFITNLEFLRVLIDSDDQCYLLVSQTVFKELHHCATAPGASKKLEDLVDNAIIFIKLLLNSGRAKTDKEVLSIFPGKEGCPIGDDTIIKCCFTLAQSYYHVILLTNDKLLERKSISTPIEIFTIEKVKRLLARYRIEKEQKNESSEILITFNSNADECVEEAQVGSDFGTDDYNIEEVIEPSESFDGYETNIQGTNINEFRSVPNEMNTANNANSAVQMHLPTSPELPAEENVLDHLPKNKPMDTTDNTANSGNESSTSGQQRKRVIRLKRKTEPHRSPRTEKKPPVKWRRRPLTKSKVTPESQTVNMQAKLSPKNIDESTTPKIQTVNVQAKLSSKNPIRIPKTIEQKNDQKIAVTASSKSQKVDVQAKLFPKNAGKRPMTLEQEITQKPAAIATSKSQSGNVQEKLTPNNIGNSDMIIEQVVKKLEAFAERNKSATPENNDVSSSINTSRSSKLNTSDRSALKIVEETSMSSSDVIPNSRSSLNSENPNFNISNYSRSKRTSNTVACEPMDTTMLDSLRTGSEEWVLAFVQIMEEVLTQVLLYSKMTIEEWEVLPLNIYKATEMVEKRFRYDDQVSKCASHFSELLLRVQDSRGSIQREINPEVYMNIFGSGDNLIRSLRSILPDCEEIKASLESLDALLNDIRAPKTFNESFPLDGHPCDRLTATDDVEEKRNSPRAPNGNSQPVQSPLQPHSPKEHPDKKTTKETKFVRTVPLDFNLLNKNKTTPQLLRPNLKNNNEKTFNKINNDESKKPSPKVCRKFSAFPELEELLKAKERENMAKKYYYEEELEYEEMDYEYEDDYAQEENYNDGEIENYQLDDAEFERELKESNEIQEFGEQEQVNLAEKPSEETLARVKKMFMKEIHDTFSFVTKFCENVYSELLHTISVDRSLEIEAQAKDDYILIETLLGKLNGILERESNETGNMKSLVQNSVRGRVPDYREIIEKCTVQANILLEALNPIKNIRTNLNLAL